MERLRIGVVGAGRLGGFHARKLASLGQVDLIGVADPNETARETVGRECGTRGLADYEALLDTVDAVVIAAPTTLHHAIGCRFLERGVHVLMEKPLARTAAEAEQLAMLAQRKGCVLQVGHVERFNPALATAAPHLENPKYIDAVRASGFTFRSTDIGVVLDLMIHDIDLVLSLVRSPVARIEAMGVALLGAYEDVANARLHFENGCVATLSASRVSHRPARRMDIWTPKGFASIDFASRRTQLVQPSETLLAGRLRVDDMSPEQIEHYKQHLQAEHMPVVEYEDEAVDALELEQADFLEAIRQGREPRVSASAGRDAVTVAHSILESIDRHAWEGRHDGPVGPHAIPRPSIVPAPHFQRLAPGHDDEERRKAG